MANKEEHEEHPPRGNEWEVVSLTSSAYAAAPGESIDARKYNAYYGAETSRDLYMSDYFVFPPSEHENLPIDETLVKDEQRKDGEESMLEDQGLSDKGQDPRFHYEVGKDKQNIYDESAIGSSKYMESIGSETALYEQGLTDAEPNESAEGILDLNSDLEGRKDAKNPQHNLPCVAWWKRRTVSIYSRTREANAIWSLFFAAAVTGLVVLGQRWQQERWQVLQLKWQSSISSEKLSRVLEPLSRLKNAIVRSSPQASLVRSGPSSEI